MEESNTFVSTHKEVIQALKDNKISFTVVRPDRNLKSEYLQRFVDRKSPEAFVSLLDKHWDNFIDDLEGEPKQIVLTTKQHLSDVIHKII